MQFLKRITPFFLSFILIACCLTFQADAFAPTTNTTNTSWVISNFELTTSQNAYQINLRKAHSIFENNFSIFNFQCCLKQHNILCSVQYNKQLNLHTPIKAKYLKAILQSSVSKDEAYIG
jgi:hypothetical protein